MVYKIGLEWKDFPVKLDRMHRHLKEQCSEYDGIIADDEGLQVVLLSYNEADIIRVDDYWESLTVENEQQVNPEELKDIIKNTISSAMDFGKNIMVDFAVENVMLGITQNNKTKEVLDYLVEIKSAIDTGSLYTVIDEINKLKEKGLPDDLAPYITEERLDRIKSKIEDYLGL